MVKMCEKHRQHWYIFFSYDVRVVKSWGVCKMKSCKYWLQDHLSKDKILSDSKPQQTFRVDFFHHTPG